MIYFIKNALTVALIEHNLTDLPMLKILVADDREIFLEGLKHVLSQLDGEISVDTAADGDELLQKAAKNAPYDLILTDWTVAGTAWLDVLQKLKENAPDTPIAVLSPVFDREIALRAVDGGAAGFILKTSPNKTILSALYLILSGGLYLPAELTEPGETAQNAAQIKGLLTARQADVLRLMGQGKSNKVIARELDLSEGTVKLHVTSILKALNVTNRTGAVVTGRNLGLIK